MKGSPGSREGPGGSGGTARSLRRGEVYLALLEPGADLHGFRPVIVISHDAFNAVESWRSVTVVPLSTSSGQARQGPTSVWIPDGAGGLRGGGAALCHQLTTVDRAKLTQRLGALPAEVMRALEVGIRAALDLR